MPTSHVLELICVCPVRLSFFGSRADPTAASATAPRDCAAVAHTDLCAGHSPCIRSMFFFPHTRAALGYSLRRFLSLVESMKKLCSCICHGCRARFGLLQCCDARGLRPRSSGFYLISCNTQPCFLVLWLSLEPPLICCSEHQARLPSEPQSPLQDLGFCWSGTGT